MLEYAKQLEEMEQDTSPPTEVEALSVLDISPVSVSRLSKFCSIPHIRVMLLSSK